MVWDISVSYTHLDVYKRQLGYKGYGLINQVGFSGSFEESKSDDSYRNDPTVECVSQNLLLWVIFIFYFSLKKICQDLGGSSA